MKHLTNAEIAKMVTDISGLKCSEDVASPARKYFADRGVKYKDDRELALLIVNHRRDKGVWPHIRRPGSHQKVAVDKVEAPYKHMTRNEQFAQAAAIFTEKTGKDCSAQAALNSLDCFMRNGIIFKRVTTVEALAEIMVNFYRKYNRFPRRGETIEFKFDNLVGGVLKKSRAEDSIIKLEESIRDILLKLQIAERECELFRANLAK